MTSPAAPAFRISPTTKFVLLGYVVVSTVVAAALVVALTQQAPTWVIYSVVAIDLIVSLPIAVRHIQLRYTTLALEGETLRYEEGVLSRSTRSLHLQKVQDIRVDQGILQRIFGVGVLTLETAGETGRISIGNIDRPQEIADQILALARKKDL